MDLVSIQDTVVKKAGILEYGSAADTRLVKTCSKS